MASPGADAGGANVPGDSRDTRTMTTGEACAPSAVTLTAPVATPPAGNALERTSILNWPFPVPVPSTIRIQPWSAVAFHFTTPVPACVSVTTCAAVADVN